VQIFPKWVNKTPLVLAAVLPVGLVAVSGLVWYYFSPWYTQVGYQPKQPVQYSHKLHAGEMGMDCRYCHYAVEQHDHANVPPTQVCMNCHAQVKADSVKLAPVRESYAQDKPIEWVRINKIPDHAHFKHQAHVQAGVGCVECHGRIDQMPVVSQVKPLSMGWCIDCHRNPAPHLRPKEFVTKMDWEPTDADKEQAKVRAQSLAPPQHCSGCHY